MSLTSSQLNTLCEMLTYCRPHGSAEDYAFRAKYIESLPGVFPDLHDNLHVRIGDSPILWSSHTDTIHYVGGRQTVRVDANRQTIRLSRRSRKRSSCLGADDTVGVFLMVEMIKAEVPGHYVFHYGEESGCLGSSDLVYSSPELLHGARFAIALDRAGTSDVVTYQHGRRCASDAFAHSLAAQLCGQFTPARGIYTDTAEYMDVIPECTNLSVGYYHAHSRDEYIDFAHVGDLLAALVQLDSSRLVCERDPLVEEYEPHTSFMRNTTYAPLSPSLPHAIRGDFGRYGWDDWCNVCDAPILDPHDPDYEVSDRCICSEDDADEDSNGYTKDDRAFLRYLLGLD